MPAWRSASPKKWKTFPLKTSPTTRAQNLAISPNEAIQSFGTDQPGRQPHYLITEISGWVASSVCVKT